MSETPRTDAYRAAKANKSQDNWAAFARELERELASERALSDRLVGTIDDLVWDFNLGPHTGAGNSLAAWKEARSE